jgi:membrane-associated phospholipid phosphatase
MAERNIKQSRAELRQQAKEAEVIDGGQSPSAPHAPIVARRIRHYRALVFQSYVVAATVGFGVLFFYARRVAYFSFDLTLARWLQRGHTFGLDVLMQAVSQLGFTPLAPAFVILTVLIVYLIGLKWEAVMLLFAGIGVGLLELTVKLAVRRQRPTAELVNVFRILNDYSFPSGHVLLFTVFLGFLMFLIYTLTRRCWARTCGMIALGALIALVGVSRVYLGEHWPSDVLGAYLLGTLWLALTIYVYRKGKPHFFVHQPLAPGQPHTTTRSESA